MNKIKCIAATGLPLENTGYMLPVFQKKNGECFEVGGRNFSQTLKDDLITEETAILLEPLELKGSIFSTTNMHHTNKEADHYGFPAYIFFFSEKAAKSLGGNKLILEIATNNQAIHVKQKKGVKNEWTNYVLVLIDHENLINGLIPQINRLCKRLIDMELVNRMKSNVRKSDHLVKDEKDELAELAQIMLNITDRNNLDDAIGYYGAMLLLSPLKNNYRVWLDFVLHRWNHQEKSINHWMKMSLGIYDSAIWKCNMLQTKERYNEYSSLANQVADNKQRIIHLERQEKITDGIEYLMMKPALRKITMQSADVKMTFDSLYKQKKPEFIVNDPRFVYPIEGMKTGEIINGGNQ